MARLRCGASLRLSGRWRSVCRAAAPCSKGPRALPVILLPDGSVAQSELAAMEALAAVFVADFGAGAQRVTIADLQEQLDALVGAECDGGSSQRRSELPDDCKGWRLVSL